MRRITFALLIVAAFALGITIARLSTTTPRPSAPPTNTKRAIAQALTASSTQPPTQTTQTVTKATSVGSPSPALPTLTASHTLKPPPTIEPPTSTIPATTAPTSTPTPTIDLSVSIPGLLGLSTPTAALAAGCVPRKDWKLTYTVQFNDALSRIADKYSTTVDDLVKGNCLKDRNVIVVGQVLKVPGTAQPFQPAVPCVPVELLTPFNGTLNVPGGGSITFTWHGPRAPYNLIRIFRPDGSTYEDVVEIRQDEVIDAQNNLAASGTYKWYIYPLGSDFVQDCPEGGPYYFTKAQAPTATPTVNQGGGGGGATRTPTRVGG